MLKIISSLVISIALVSANEVSEEKLLSDALKTLENSLQQFEKEQKNKVDEKALKDIVSFIDNELDSIKKSYKFKKGFNNLQNMFNNFYQGFDDNELGFRGFAFPNFENQIQNMFPKRFDSKNFTPSMNMREDEKAYYIDVDLPGISKDEIDIKVVNNILTISGERKSEIDIKEKDYYKMESSYGKFQRSLTLPSDADSNSIKASSKNGVLEIKIDKLKSDKAKKIEVM